MPSPFTIGIAVGLVTLIVLHRLLSKPALKGVPYATSSIPLIGVAVAFGRDPVGFLRQQRAIHGDIFCVDLLVTRITFMLGVEHNARIVHAREEELSLYDMMDDRMGAFFKDGMANKAWFPIGMRNVKNNFNAKSMLDWSETIATSTISNTLLSWSEITDGVDMFQSMSTLFLFIFIQLILGEQFYVLHGPEMAGMIQRYAKALQHPLLTVVPRWTIAAGRELNRVEIRIVELLEEEVARRREMDAKNPGSGDAGEEYFATILKQVGINNREHDGAYGCHILFVLFASFLNMAPTVSWMMIHALSTPEVYDRIRKDVLEGEREGYLNACMRESLRLYTNILFLRKTTEKGFELKLGMNLPVGEVVGASPVVISRDEDLFGQDASSFLPERFMDSEKTARWVKKFAVLPFGGGVHACKGETIAWKVVTELFWKLIVKEGYEFEAVEGIHLWPGVDGDDEAVVEEGRRDVECDSTGVKPEWVTDNLGTPFAKGVFVRVVRNENKVEQDIDDFLNASHR